MTHKGLVAAAPLLSMIALGAAAQPTSDSATAKRYALAYKTRVERLRTEQASKPPPASLTEALEGRIFIDQAARRFEWESGPEPVSIDAQRAAFELVRPTMRAVDEDNTAWLKTVIPSDGWFRLSRDGPTAANFAFLIVQHSPDREWQRQVLSKMEPLLKTGEVSAQAYALLYDRVQMGMGKKQLYGTQAECRKGIMGMVDMEEPEPVKVQARRDAIGFTRPRYDDYRMLFEGHPC